MRFAFIFLSFFVLALNTTAFGSERSPEIDAAIAYLVAEQNADGSIRSETDIANPEQTTNEAVLALARWERLSELDIPWNAPLPSDLSGLSTEYLARLAVTRRIAGDASSSELVGELTARQNADGGFGPYQGSQSTAHATANALRVLARVSSHSVDIGIAINWLLVSQDASGGWRLNETLDRVTSALSMHALWHYRHEYDVGQPLSMAQQWLLAQRDAAGLWSDLESSVFVLHVMALTLQDKSVLEDARANLLALQQANGQWGEGVYETALALQALHGLHERPADEIVLKGRVIDKDSGLPLPSATVQLSGPASSTSTVNAEGGFEFAFFGAGSYRLDISGPEHPSVSLGLLLDAGEMRDIGTIELARGLVSPETATLLGTVKDKVTGVAVTGATVNVLPAGRSVVSDVDGSYRIENIDPATSTISVSADGYFTASTSIDLEAGQFVNFSPRMIAISAEQARVFGRITDSETGLPLESVRVILTTETGDLEVITDALGEFSIEALEPGAATIRLEKDAYHSISSSWEMKAGAAYDVSSALTPVDQAPAEPPQTRIQGVIFGSHDGLPIQSVRVAAYSYTQGKSAVVYSDVEGRFLIENIHGDVNLDFYRSGFYSQNFRTEIPAGVTVDIGQIEMLSSSVAGAAIKGRVLSGVDETPVTSAAVWFYYAGSYQYVYTDSQGEFYRNYLPAEEIKIRIDRGGFEPREVFAHATAGEILDLGDIYLRPADEEDPRPDLVIRRLEQAGVFSDPQSFALSGTMKARIENVGTATASGSVELIAFHDRNANGKLDSLDAVFGRDHVALNLAPESALPIELEVAGNGSFRDVPLSVAVDTANTVIESREHNNVASGAGRCSENDGGTMDLAMCLDASGSVSYSNFQLQTAGTAEAIANPDIVPHDGRVRLSVFRFNSWTSKMLEPTVITEENAEEVAEFVRNIRYSGGGTAIHSCVNVATNTIANFSPASDYQVIDVSTDGASSHSAAMQASARARDLGIDAINGLAVGPGANVALLNDMVFPQPSGGESGFVIAIDSYQGYADAIATKVQRETRVANLAIGGLKLVEDNGGMVAKVRVGNAGNRTVPAGIPVVIHAGQPNSEGEELGRVELPELGESDYIDLAIPLSHAPASGASLYAVVDPAGTIEECARSNNTTTIVVSSVRAELVIKPSAAVYPADTEAIFNAVTNNTGQIAGVFSARLWIEDLAGTLVADLGQQHGSLVEPGKGESLPFAWQTGLTLAGQYRVRGELRNEVGQVVDTAAATFALRHDAADEPLASLRVTSDQASYHTTDHAMLDLLVRNRSANTVITSAALRVTLLNGTGEIIGQSVQAFSDLAPGAARQVAVNFDWVRQLPGELLVVAELTDATTQVLATADAALPLEEKLSRALRGSVSAEKLVVPRMLPQVCNWEATYAGTYSSINLPLRLNVVSLVNETVMQTFPQVVDLPDGVPYGQENVLGTRDYAEGMAACVLEAEINGAWQALANAVFRVDPPPIEINAILQAGERGRLLVLLDAGCETSEETGGSCNADPYGPDDAPPLDIQRTHLESVLTTAGWTYQIVDSAQDFADAFHSGAYEAYGLFNEEIKLSESLQREIVGDIETGRGLLLAGNHDRRNGRLENALGIKSLGKNLDVEQLVVQPFGDHEGGEWQFAVAHRPNALRLEGAGTLAEYELRQKGKKTPQPEPAITRFEHGAGKGLYAGFDWPVQSAMQGDNGEFAGLLTATLQLAHPEPYAPVAGRVFPLQVTLQNEGIAIPGEVRLALPSGTSVHEGPTGVVIENGIATWPFTVGEDEQTTFTVWLRLPEIEGPIELEAVVYAGDNGELEEYARSNLVLNVQPGS